MRNTFKITSLVTILFLSACGGGGSSSGGGGGGQPARECIDGQTDVFTNTTMVTNSCSFNVNVLDLSDNATIGVTLIPANSTVTLNDGILFFGACRAPSVPIKESTVQFTCS